jgi:heterodisulfide reductase subunit C
MPKKKFFNKAKTTTLSTFNGFIKATSECNKDFISGPAEKKIRSILNSKTFSEENLVHENALIIAIKKWAEAILNYSDEVSKARKTLNLDEINLLTKVIKSAMIMVQKHEVV